MNSMPVAQRLERARTEELPGPAGVSGVAPSCDSGPVPTMTPRQRIESECARRGKDAVVDDCIALLRGSTDLGRLRSLSAAGAYKFADGKEHDDIYWFRVWAMRGLLWAWDPRATDFVREALRDDAWRVREMAAKVVARHLVGDAHAEVAACRHDPVERVRMAAERALVRLTAAAA